MNTSGIRPMEYKVLVQPIEVKRQTAGGLHLPDTEVEKSEYARTEGVLVAISPVAFSFANWGKAKPPAPGDKVVFARYNAHEITGRDGAKYWLMNDTSIEAVME